MNQQMNYNQIETQEYIEEDSNLDLIEMQNKLLEREQNHQHLSKFETYLKDKLTNEIMRKQQEKTIEQNDSTNFQRRKLARSHLIETQQEIYENVQKHLQMQQDEVQTPINQMNQQQYNSLNQQPSSSSEQKYYKFKKFKNDEYNSLQRTRPSTSMKVDSVGHGDLFTQKDENQLNKLRKQYNMQHFYQNWLNEKKIRLNSQIDAYVNSIQKLNPIEQQQEEQILKDKLYLSSDKRKHIERIMSASQSSKYKSHQNYITLHSNPSSLTPIQINSPTLQQTSYKQFRIQSAIYQNNIANDAKKINNSNNNDTLKTNKQKNLNNNNNQTPQNKNNQSPKKSANITRPLSSNKNASNKKNTTQQKAVTASNILESKNEITLFTNFVYNSPFPKWLVQNRKYEELKQSEQYDMNKKIISICKMESFNRNAFQKHLVALFLSKMSLFQMMPFHMLEVIAQRLTYLFVDQTQYICKQGDKGDCMYIIFQGQVEIIINGFLIKKVFCGGEFVGRTALETDQPRNADMRAKQACHLLVLSRMDYQQCLSRAIINEKGNISHFILNHPFFRHFRTDKVERLCEEIKARFLGIKECLYKEGNAIDNFYIVKKGHLIKTMQVELEQQNRWPTKDSNGQIYWENQIQSKKVTYTIDFTAGDIVGYYDIMIPNENQIRTETMDSVEDTFVLFVNKNIFNMIFDEDDMILFKEYHRKKYPSNQESLKQKVKEEEGVMKANIQALEDGVRLKLQSCELGDLEKKNQKINQFIKQNRQKKKEELKKKLPYEYKPKVIRRLQNQND